MILRPTVLPFFTAPATLITEPVVTGGKGDRIGLTPKSTTSQRAVPCAILQLCCGYWTEIREALPSDKSGKNGRDPSWAAGLLEP